MTAKDSISNSLYTKLGIHKEFYLKNCFYKSPRFGFTGAGGEIIRGSPGYPINKYKKKISSAYKIKGHEQELFESSMRICNRSVILLKKKKNITMTMKFHQIYIHREGQGIILVNLL